MYFFTADEHYNHANMIKYLQRPFRNPEEMNKVMIANHNAIVMGGDTTIHAGDFFFRQKGSSLRPEDIIPRLNGQHIFLRGNHDRWLKGKNAPDMWTHRFWLESLDGVADVHKKRVVVCHYKMAIWQDSHYNSWHLFGHSHGRSKPVGKSLDVGVDNCSFKPTSIKQIQMYMEQRPNNDNFIGVQNED